MKTATAAVSLLLLSTLSGCQSDPTLTPAQITAKCNTVQPHEKTDPGLACFNTEGSLPTAIDFGDSVSLGTTAAARHDLCGVVDYRHDKWEKGDINVCGENYLPYFKGQVIAHANNNGYSATELSAMKKQLIPDAHYNVILFNSGLHDMQDSVRYPGQRNVPLDAYRANLEAISALVEKHADVVIWINTTPIPVGATNFPGFPAGEQDVYNPVAEAVAREHGFYILDIEARDQIPNNIHFESSGYEFLGSQVKDCVLAAMQQQETQTCHH